MGLSNFLIGELVLKVNNKKYFDKSATKFLHFTILNIKFNTNMKYSVNKDDIYTVVKIEEKQINSLNAPHLKSELVFFHNEGVVHLILDLDNIEYVDSSGLSAILTGHRLWRDSGVFVICRAKHPAVRRLIEISKLDKILIIIPTLDEAIDYVMMEQLERDFASEEE